MKKALIITYHWPPRGGGGVQRWLKTVKYLKGSEWEPIVFTAEDANTPIEDESLFKDVPENLEVLKEPIFEPFNIYKWFTGKKKDEKVYGGFVEQEGKQGYTQYLAYRIRGEVFIPDAKMFWIKPSVKHILKYLKKNEVDLIVSTGPPHSTHLIALKVKKKTGIKWLADFRDPWTEIDYYKHLLLSKRADRKHKKQEQKVLKNADIVTTVSWSWAKGLSRLGNRDIEVITNGFDEEDFNNKETQLDDKFSFIHAGSLNSDRNPKKLWKSLAELMKNDKTLQDKLEIKLIGPTDHSVIQDLNRHDLIKNTTFIESLPHKDVVKELQRSQVLLLPLNDTPNIDGVIPGKLYEYMGARRPIFCIGKPEGDAGKIINNTTTGKIIDFRDDNKMREVINEWFNDFLKGELQVNSKNIENYSRKKLAKDFARLFDKLQL